MSHRKKQSHLIRCMAGDAKTDEYFYRVTLRDDFQSAVKKCRQTCGIPATGFTTSTAARKWEKSLSEVKRAEFFMCVDNIWLAYRFSYVILPRVERYVLTNRTNTSGLIGIEAFSEIDPRGLIARRHRKNKRSFVSLLIYDRASLKEVQNYLKTIWPYVKRDLERQAGKQLSRIRTSSHKERDEDIIKLYEKSREELGLKKGEYKQIAVARIISEKYGRVEPEHVQRIVARRRRMRRGDT